jgi:putative polyhydroxyalkanoate system protein
MPDIDIKRAHNLGMKAARAAAEKMAEQLGRKFGLQGDWQGNVLNFERPGVTGALAVDDKDVRLTVNLGLLLKMMRPSIEGAVHEELDKLFAKKGQPSPRPSPKGEGVKSKKAPPRPKKGG